MKDSLKIILFAQLLMPFFIVLDIPIARQIFVFIYISFLPGFLILCILNINLKDRIDILVFSIGLSIAFMMFIGLFINELYPILGIYRPLSSIPLTITYSVLIFLLFLFNYKQNLSNMNYYSYIESKNISFQALLLFFIPILSVIGALFENSFILLITIIIIATLYVISCFTNRVIISRLYPLIIFSISLALLLHTSLISKYLIGFDVHRESYVFQITKNNYRWYTSIPSATLQTSNYNSMLSVTILPTIYSSLMKINTETLFKIIYILIFSLIPLSLFQIYKNQTEKLIALVSVFFFISNTTSFFGVEPISLCKQRIGELFFVLSILIVLYKEISPKKRQTLFLVFGISLIVSHYSLSYIYIFYIFFTLIFLHLRGTKTILNWIVVLYLIIMKLLWDIYVSVTIFKNLNLAFARIYYRFYLDFFDIQSRSPRIERILMPAPTMLDQINIILFYLVHFFIVIGITKLILKRNETKFNPEYRLISILSIFINLICLIIPNLAPILRFERIRSITLLSLSPFFVLGGKDFFIFIRKRGAFIFNKMKNDSYTSVNWNLRLVSFVLVSFFLFQIGFITHIMDDKPISYSLDIHRMKTTNNPEVKIYFYHAYTPEQDVFSAIWISKNVKETSIIYSDRIPRVRVLASYGMISGEQVYLLSNSMTLGHDAYVYLRYLNVVEGLANIRVESFNFTEILSLLNENNKIYSNGGSEIYRASGN